MRKDLPDDRGIVQRRDSASRVPNLDHMKRSGINPTDGPFT
jgi:hypothetical protein